MRSGAWRRRAVAAVVMLSLVGAVAVSESAYGDPVVDKRAEARSVAASLEQLQAQAEVLTEQYNDARLALAAVERRVAAAHLQARRTHTALAARRQELADYAVNAYVRGDDGLGMSVLLSAKDGNAIDRRRGYVEAALGDRAQLVDQLRAAQATADGDVARLDAVRLRSVQAKEAVDGKRRAAQATITRQSTLLAQVRGQLAALVAAEETHLTAENARRAAAANRRFVAASVPVRQSQATTSSKSSTSGNGTSSAVVQSSVGSTGVGQGAGAGAAVAAARSALGVRYTWGGASPTSGFDCSGLVMWAWQHGGKSLPHSSSAQYGASRHIAISELQPGDLVFYGSPVSHVGLYVGGGQMIHAPHSGASVRYDSIYYWDALVGAGRV